MSYILDALRKAEADRKLGETAGVHDPAPAPSSDTPSSSAALQRWLPGVAVGLLLGLTGTLAWLLMGGDDDKGSAATPTRVDAAVIEQPITNQSEPPASYDVPDDAAPDDAVVQLPRAMPAPGKSKPETTAVANPVSSSTGAAAPVRLTAELRATLPPLAVGGAMYSDVPASRMVVINGQLFREGDTVAPGITLEQIQLKSAILRHQGQRYLLDY